ncbi:hypothetical protein [Opitutus terrae]|nr:hypothetical protein [Opitutus terrae]
MKGSSSRLVALLLLAAGAVGVLVLSFRPSRVEQAATPPPQAPHKEWTPLKEPTESPEPEPQLPHGPEEQESAVPPDRLDPNEARPAAGTGEAYLHHLAASVVEANAAALQLDGAQQQRLVEDFLEFQEIHAELAAQHLRESGFDGYTLTAQVPPFLSEGRALRDLFYERLKQDFPEASPRITEEMGAFFDTHFRGYGGAEQAFTVTRSPQHPDAFQIEWRAEPVEGAASGRADAPYAGSSGVVVFSRDQIKNGEFRFLGDLIDRRFP